MNNDKLIDREELRKMVCAASEYIDMHLSTEQVDKLVNDTFLICDKDKNGVIDYEEYCAFCRENPRILQPFTIDVTNLIEYERESRRQQRTPLDNSGRKLHHGPMQVTTDAGRISKWKHSLGRKIQKLTKNDIVNVEPIHEPKDVLRDLQDNESSNETDDASFLAGGGKMSDYLIEGDVESSRDKTQGNTTSHMTTPGDTHTQGWHSDNESTRSKDDSKHHDKQKSYSKRTKDKEKSTHSTETSDRRRGSAGDTEIKTSQ
ncbi:hypothetical protein RFI_18120 [Reticulomyxa filosa]|uniref:EF-hand domain-containing protein n=1 Tax=Reticulomyxa filosa TaxID=46433 RepID=X6N052_RETFI|nr:hypothetical protein RFI_18120 [Reticulomyxa filosa]|eukprot:ETO19119.1 hypothetical protein RFI_18120 [Reticulomyxa filosa]